MNDRLIRTGEVSTITGLALATIQAKANPNSASYDEGFPAAVRIGKRALGFSEREIHDWVNIRRHSVGLEIGTTAQLAYLELQNDGSYRLASTEGHTLRIKGSAFQYWYHSFTVRMLLSPSQAARLSWDGSPRVSRIDLIDPETGQPSRTYDDRLDLFLRQPVYNNGLPEMKEESLNPTWSIGCRLCYEPLLERLALLLHDRPFDRVRHEPLELHIDQLLATEISAWRNPREPYLGTICEGPCNDGNKSYDAESALTVLSAQENILALQDVHITCVLLEGDRLLLDLAEPYRSYVSDKYINNDDALRLFTLHATTVPAAAIHDESI